MSAIVFLSFHGYFTTDEFLARHVIRLEKLDQHLSEGIWGGSTVGFSRVVGVEDSPAGKTRHEYTSLLWGAAVATSAVCRVGHVFNCKTRPSPYMAFNNSFPFDHCYLKSYSADTLAYNSTDAGFPSVVTDTSTASLLFAGTN
jgi:hypothetical protein